MKKKNGNNLKEESQLRKCFLNSNWEEIFPRSIARNNFQKNKEIVQIQFYTIKKPNVLTQSQVVSIRMGENVLNKLGWKKNNKIVVFQAKDDLFSLKLVRTENGNGYTLKSQNGKLPMCFISFTWPHKNVPLEERPYRIVEHEIFNGNILVFRA